MNSAQARRQHRENLKANRKFVSQAVSDAGLEKSDIDKFFDDVDTRMKRIAKNPKKTIAAVLGLYAFLALLMAAGVIGFIAVAAYVVKLVLA